MIQSDRGRRFAAAFYYHDCLGRIPGDTTRESPIGFELETNSFQFYAIVRHPLYINSANLTVLCRAWAAAVQVGRAKGAEGSRSGGEQGYSGFRLCQSGIVCAAFMLPQIIWPQIMLWDFYFSLATAFTQ